MCHVVDDEINKTKLCSISTIRVSVMDLCFYELLWVDHISTLTLH